MGPRIGSAASSIRDLMGGEIVNRVRRIGINALFLQPRMGGLETYVRELVPALLEARPELEIRLYVNHDGNALLRDEPWASEVDLVSHPLLGRPGTRAVTEATLLGFLASRDRLDVLHNVALTAPLSTRPANVVLLADVTWLRQPETVGRGRSLLWRLLVLPAARRADRLITLSEAARQEIVTDVKVSADRIDVIHLGRGTTRPAEPMREGELRCRLELGAGPIVLSVSALTPHKNIGALIDAIRFLRSSHPDVRLVVPGNPSAHGEVLARHAKKVGVESNVRFPGWVSPGELEGLYRAARCFAFASVREGFGLPLLEAMARGVPVACSNVSALPEIAGDAAVYFDPHVPAEIAGALARVLDDESFAQELAARGKARQRQFTWKRTAEETLQSFERAIGDS
jgi:glycosyltransferase involved in cell wall biosynthesis